jgi:hypothetical protein
MSAAYPLSSCIEWPFAETGELDAHLRIAALALAAVVPSLA